MAHRSLFLAVLLVMVASFVSSLEVGTRNDVSENNGGACTLQCPEGAPCVFGAASTGSHHAVMELEGSNHKDGMHCDCPEGWTGIYCDHKYETCDNQAGHTCYHGGECIPGLEDKYGNDQLFCDCSKARGEDGVAYTGKYCEVPFEQVCNDPEDDEDLLFCVNGGSCNPDFPEAAAFPCICDKNYEGYHCEFKTNTVPDCLLNCQNGGTCVVGVTSPSEAKHMHHKWSLEEVEDHMRCVCPPGFGGAFCESPSEQCGDSICLNGGTCVTTTQVLQDGVAYTQHHCDCTNAGDVVGNLYAGKFCEHVASSMCSETDWNLFCTQGGQCKSNPIEGCSSPSGTSGYKCEFLLDNMYNDGTTTQDGDIDREFGDSQDEDGDNDSQSTRCGDGYCQNGASCVIEEVINGNGVEDIKQFCDCSEAAATNGAYYAGKFCQYQSTSICGGQGNFCVHHGDCQDDGTCDCPVGWTGDHCEMSWSDDSVPGDIQEGQGEICGENVCYNGGVCGETEMIGPDGSLTVTLHCDCSSAYDDQYSYAGLNCDFPSTSLCTQAAPGEDLADVLFCVNHGTCMDNPRLGCDCPPGFYGFACEYESHNHDQDGDGVPDMEDEDNFSDDDWEICGDDGLVCHNGGRCETTVVQNSETGNTETIHSCDCRLAYDGDTPFSGVSCEYPATALCAPANDGEPPTLGQFCTNHGTCRTDPSQGSCDCPDGFTGSSCQFKTSYDDIVNVDDGEEPIDHEDCGDDLVCLNGGTCVTTILAGSGGEDNMEIKHCDCAVAVDETEIFAGKQCEFKATNLCSSPADGSVGNIHFCVNGGECPDGNNPMMPCKCDVAWEGFHCEYAVRADDLPPQFHDNIDDDDNDGCGLQCMNGGYCAEGAKDLGSLHDTISDVYHLNQTFDEEHFAHCVCPEGYVGLTCQHKMEVCGDEEHVCLHGSTCVEHENGQHSCDCSEADEIIGDNDKKFAGDSCQYPGTDICTIGEGYPGEPLYFCVNGGSCNAQVTPDQPDPGCQCPDDYIGSHCETLMRVSSESTNGSAGAGMIAGVALAVIAVSAIAVAVAFRMARSRSHSPVEESSPASGTGTPFPRRRRRKAGYGGSNLAPGHKTSPASTPVAMSSSDPVASGFALPPDDEPELGDAVDGILKEPTNGEPDFVDVVGPQQEADFV